MRGTARQRRRPLRSRRRSSQVSRRLSSTRHRNVRDVAINLGGTSTTPSRPPRMASKLSSSLAGTPRPLRTTLPGGMTSSAWPSAGPARLARAPSLSTARSSQTKPRSARRRLCGSERSSGPNRSSMQASGSHSATTIRTRCSAPAARPRSSRGRSLRDLWESFKRLPWPEIRRASTTIGSSGLPRRCGSTSMARCRRWQADLGITAPMRPVFSDFTAGGPSLSVRSLDRLLPASGTLISRAVRQRRLARRVGHADRDRRRRGRRLRDALGQHGDARRVVVGLGQHGRGRRDRQPGRPVYAVSRDADHQRSARVPRRSIASRSAMTTRQPRAAIDGVDVSGTTASVRFSSPDGDVDADGVQPRRRRVRRLHEPEGVHRPRSRRT